MKEPTHHDWEEEWDSKWTRPRSGECDNGCCKMWEGKRDFQSEGQKEFIKKLVDQVRKEERQRVIEIVEKQGEHESKMREKVKDEMSKEYHAGGINSCSAILVELAITHIKNHE